MIAWWWLLIGCFVGICCGILLVVWAAKDEPLLPPERKLSPRGEGEQGEVEIIWRDASER